MKTRLDVTTLGLTTGKKGRLHRILYQSGLRNGTALLLPYGHGLAHRSGGLAAGAAAVGYTLYLNSPVQEPDFSPYRQVQQDADRWHAAVRMGISVRHDDRS